MTSALREIILLVVAVLGFACGVAYIIIGLRRRRLGERFSIMEFAFRTKSISGASGTQLVGEGICVLLLAISAILINYLWR